MPSRLGEERRGAEPSLPPGIERLKVTYMARKDAIWKMREILVVRRDALRKALAGDLSLLKELRDQSAGDVVDFALDSAQHEINSQLAEVESRELASIENALERMRTGHYGVCEQCSIKIPMARLNALPYATLCIECQRDAERQGTVGGSEADWGRLIDSSGDMELSINDIEIDVS
ncbi:MAG: TraR/DksA family transcriptional regulator [Pirellulales bacterium]